MTAVSPALRLAVFASGNGTNMEAIARAIDDGYLNAEIVLCICNRSGAGVLDRARRLGIPVVVLDPRATDADTHAAQLLDVLRAHDANFVVLAGYLRKIPAPVVAAYRGRMLNIHPALLPAFGGRGMYGRRVHEAVLEYGARWSGVTVHLVDAEYDTGPVVLQEPVPVEPDDTPDTLAARLHAVEHRLFPEALRLFAEDRIRLDGRRVRILPDETSPSPPADASSNLHPR